MSCAIGLYPRLSRPAGSRGSTENRPLLMMIGDRDPVVPPTIGQPGRILSDRRGKIAVLTAGEAFPIFDNELLENVVKEPKFAARKTAKQVPIEISKDVAEVQRGRIACRLWRGIQDG